MCMGRNRDQPWSYRYYEITLAPRPGSSATRLPCRRNLGVGRPSIYATASGRIYLAVAIHMRAMGVSPPCEPATGIAVGCGPGISRKGPFAQGATSALERCGPFPTSGTCLAHSSIGFSHDLNHDLDSIGIQRGGNVARGWWLCRTHNDIFVTRFAFPSEDDLAVREVCHCNRCRSIERLSREQRTIVTRRHHSERKSQRRDAYENTHWISVIDQGGGLQSLLH